MVDKKSTESNGKGKTCYCCNLFPQMTSITFRMMDNICQTCLRVNSHPCK